jgi:hypothetical protein
MRMGARRWKTALPNRACRDPHSPQEQREGTHLGRFSVLLAGPCRSGQCWGGPLAKATYAISYRGLIFITPGRVTAAAFIEDANALLRYFFVRFEKKTCFGPSRS